jgi:hypothetical protein
MKILDYIAKDKIGASADFALGLEKKISALPDFPYKFRKSLYFDSNDIRDMIYKAYTVVYEINRDSDTLEVLQIFNRNKPMGSVS